MEENIETTKEHIDSAKKCDADLTAFPELSVTDYPPQDLLLETDFVKQNKELVKDLRILVLNTGKKTEFALGYCIPYEDMADGIGALGDVSKLEVYRLAEYVNKKAGRETIPRSVFSKKPSPELKEAQFDPFDFDIVSPLVDEFVENRRSKSELIAMGYPEMAVTDVRRRIRTAECKRWQAAPCIKITRKAFGMGWRMPIVNEYRG